MTANDYREWAGEYRREVEAIEGRIRELEKYSKTKLMNRERTRVERVLSDLFEQKIQCIGIARELEERAQAIEASEKKHYPFMPV